MQNGRLTYSRTYSQSAYKKFDRWRSTVLKTVNVLLAKNEARYAKLHQLSCSPMALSLFFSSFCKTQSTNDFHAFCWPDFLSERECQICCCSTEVRVAGPEIFQPDSRAGRQFLGFCVKILSRPKPHRLACSRQPVAVFSLDEKSTQKKIAHSLDVAIRRRRR